MKGLLMTTRRDPGQPPEAEPLTVELHDDGRLELHLDDGVVLELDFDELLEVAMNDQPVQEAA